nr:aldolase/citrate lyase family protein [Mobilisporobacter senegalensis]
MSLKLMYITNDEAIAKIAENSGVDWIFIDLEIIGKEKRQGHLDTVISHHEREDVKKIKNILSQAKIIVRVNPIHPDSENEINQIIEYGADIIMLPYFKTQKEVEYFIRLVGGRVKTCLLCETPEAVENIDSILSVSGIDYMYIGLNDLHLGYKMNFMFYLLADGTVESLCDKFRAKGIPFGFGGIARLKHGTLPAEYIIREFYRLGSSMVILSRSFCNANEILQYDMIEKVFKEGVLEIRTFEEKILTKDYSYFAKNQRILKKKVIQIENILKRQKEII